MTDDLRILTAACNAAINIIHSELSSDCDLQACGLGILQLYRSLTLTLWTSPPTQPPVLERIISRADDLLRLCTDKLHTFPYRDVPLCWRRLYTDTSILKAVAQINILVSGNHEKSSLEDGDTEIVRTLDMALIMTGAPGGERKETIEALLEKVDGYVTGITSAHERVSGKRQKVYSNDSLISPDPPTAPELGNPIDRLVGPPSLEDFTNHLNSTNTPMIISSLVSDWPALTTNPWSSASYLLSKTHGGKRLVPVELGKSYTTEGWSQKIMTFKEFMNTHVLRGDSIQAFKLGEDEEGGEREERECSESTSPKTGYLAQHTLFAQIPPLRNDILIPDYCYTTPPPPSLIAPSAPLEDPLVNAWFGPAGTISPLHTDPYSNILCQALGRKYVRLYAPYKTPYLFPRGIEDGGVDMSNTSQIDLDNMDENGERWKVFKGVEYIEGILERGDGLYIPAGWWHYVRSLDTSFSVSFWWN